jgi:hypothetical protein
MPPSDVAQLRVTGCWPELWAALMADGGVSAVYALAATMTEAEIEADLRARQAQAGRCDTPGFRQSRVSAQRSVLDHVASQLPHSA